MSSLASPAASTHNKDRLSALPTELLHHIIAYLWPTHFAEKAFHETHYLSATCKTLRSEVNDWARSWLVQHSDITKFKEGRVWPKATTKRNGVVQMRKNFNTNFLRGRHGALLNWAEAHCIFCGKKSRRAAIMMNGFRCCTQCDKNQWPEKVTMSQAVDDYGLSKKQLLPDREASHSEIAKMREEHPGFQGIWYGTYISSNVQTTMFMKDDLRRLGSRIFGDFDAHLAKREEHRKLLKQRKEERKKEKARKAAARDAHQRQHVSTLGPVHGDTVTEAIEISDDATLGADQPILID
ncbi:hypothetical protein AC578_9652 [Pseudocercospora eumusae]|uniref:F-box domain-containing protein n=1 Tax=Pseudocercospora eumusae TaxID=321146 RepID=A0A139GVU6_9PEZI|nr:hypothetical protein AC578_9652 [Pseudocercospora eumusae]